MLLAEALASRKQTLQDIQSLSAAAQAAAVRDEDDSSSASAEEDLAKLRVSLSELTSLTYLINETNNVTILKFDGVEMPLSRAILLREQLNLDARHTRALSDHISEQLRPRYGGRRTKDEIKR